VVEPGAWKAVALAFIAALIAAGWNTSRSCAMVGLHRETWRRHVTGNPSAGVVVAHKDRDYPNRVPQECRDAFMDLVNTPEYEDLSVTQAFMRMRDDGEYFFSLATAHRAVKECGQNGDRRLQRRGTGSSGKKCKPVLAAFGPNEIWSWDITMFKGPGRAVYKLYLMIDIFSRKIVGHRVETTESPLFAQQMIGAAAGAQAQYPRVLHADNGGPMRAATTAQFAAELGIKLSYSRPRVSDDNPFSEAMFKTVKYDLGFPDRFHSLKHARGYMAAFITDYNARHRHSGIKYYTPNQAHDGTHHQVHQQRQATLDNYYKQHPERFRKRPLASALPISAGINYEKNPKLPQTA
jgi:putative transposase